MKRLLLCVCFAFFCETLFAQDVVFDPQYFQSVIANGATRSTAEESHQQYLGQIRHNLTDINADMAAVVSAQTIIYNGLANVNSALTNGLEVKNFSFIIADMTEYIRQALVLGKAQPYLLLFATNIAAEMRVKGMALVNDVSGYILKSGNNVLADYNGRDELLRKVTQQLQLLDALAYGAWQAMYWAKERGMIASLDPFADFINRDKLFVLEIIQNAKYLKQ